MISPARVGDPGTLAFGAEVNSVKKAGSAHCIFLIQTQNQTIKRSWHFPLLVNLMHMGLFDKEMDWVASGSPAHPKFSMILQG